MARICLHETATQSRLKTLFVHVQHLSQLVMYNYLRKCILNSGASPPIRRASTEARPLRFDGQTAIVTGAGRGLGKEYALLLASRGANVVVNDYGGDRSNKLLADEKNKESVAQQVVDEINKRWPNVQTHADSNSISSEEGAHRLVESAVMKFGRVDILINNAGILRDVSFAKMTIDDWDQVQQVHLRGSFLVSRSCWPHMKKQDYGRIIMTSSTSGLYGNFGQANYSAAKMGLVGLSNTLAIEGRRSHIHCNAVVPMAASRMTHDILPRDLANKLNPAYVAPIVAWLCHADCHESGLLVEAAGGWFGRYCLQRTSGKSLSNLVGDGGLAEDSVEQVANSWTEITTFGEKATRLESFGDHLNKMMDIIED